MYMEPRGALPTSVQSQFAKPIPTFPLPSPSLPPPLLPPPPNRLRVQQWD